MINVTVVIHEYDGHQVEVSQQAILSEGFAAQCAQSALQSYNAHNKVLYKFPIPATDAKVYNPDGKLLARVTR